MIKEIGGYFSTEMTIGKSIYPNAFGGTVLTNTGRNALEFILHSLSKVKKVYLPYYTCEAVLQPLDRLHIPYKFYHINEQLELISPISLGKNEYIIINNYFGLQNAYVQRMADYYGEQLIVDNSQALYAPLIPDVKAFFSPRKFVGVSDGGFAWLGHPQETSLSGIREIDKSYPRNAYLSLRENQGAQAGYAAFRESEDSLDNQPIKVMSADTRTILSKVDFDTIRSRRQSNYYQLHMALKDSNKLHLPLLNSNECPMVYPYWTEDDSLRQRLIDNHIYVAKYWPNIADWCQSTDLEYELMNHLLPLPIDQRYGEEEMKKIIKIICKSQK